MRSYIAFYNGKQVEVSANSSYEAQTKAAKMLNVSAKNQYRVTVMLADVEHSTAAL